MWHGCLLQCELDCGHHGVIFHWSIFSVCVVVLYRRDKPKYLCIPGLRVGKGYLFEQLRDPSICTFNSVS